jgi:hypothetical protein
MKKEDLKNKKVFMENINAYAKLLKKKEKLEEKIEPELEKLVKVYAMANNDPYDYIEEFSIENGIIQVIIHGYRFGEVTNYYDIPVDYLFDKNAAKKIKKAITIKNEEENKKYEAKKLQEEELEYRRLVKKFEDK